MARSSGCAHRYATRTFGGIQAFCWWPNYSTGEKLWVHGSKSLLVLVFWRLEKSLRRIAFKMGFDISLTARASMILDFHASMTGHHRMTLCISSRIQWADSSALHKIPRIRRPTNRWRCHWHLVTIPYSSTTGPPQYLIPPPTLRLQIYRLHAWGPTNSGTSQLAFKHTWRFLTLKATSVPITSLGLHHFPGPEAPLK